MSKKNKNNLSADTEKSVGTEGEISFDAAENEARDEELTESEKKSAKVLIGVLIGVVVVAIAVGGVLAYNFYFKDKIEAKSFEEQKADAAADKADIKISEDLFVSWINEIYTNSDAYLGKKISIDGMFKSEVSDTTGTTYYFVYRVGPGCCGNDGATCGFEMLKQNNMPAEGDWVSVTGTLDQYDEDGYKYLYLKDPVIKVENDKRGAETVKQ